MRAESRIDLHTKLPVLLIQTRNAMTYFSENPKHRIPTNSCSGPQTATHGWKDEAGVGSRCTLLIFLANSLKTGETRTLCHIVTNGKHCATSHRMSNTVPHCHIGRLTLCHIVTSDGKHCATLSQTVNTVPHCPIGLTVPYRHIGRQTPCHMIANVNTVPHCHIGRQTLRHVITSDIKHCATSSQTVNTVPHRHSKWQVLPLHASSWPSLLFKRQMEKENDDHSPLLGVVMNEWRYTPPAFFHGVHWNIFFTAACS
jgi:hypothetical protein